MAAGGGDGGLDHLALSVGPNGTSCMYVLEGIGLLGGLAHVSSLPIVLVSGSSELLHCVCVCVCVRVVIEVDRTRDVRDVVIFGDVMRNMMIADASQLPWVTEWIQGRRNGTVAESTFQWRESRRHVVLVNEPPLEERWELYVVGGNGVRPSRKWLEVAYSEKNGRYGLFAGVRFQNGDIISASAPDESTVDGATPPTVNNIGLGLRWAAQKAVIGTTFRSGTNAATTCGGNLLVATARIKAGDEIIVGVPGDRRVEFIGCLVLDAKYPVEGLSAVGCIRGCVFAENGGGTAYKVVFNGGRQRTMNEDEVKSSLVGRIEYVESS